MSQDAATKPRPLALDPPADEAGVPPYPAPLDPAMLPAHLRDNPIVRLHLALPPEVEATLAGLAAQDAEEDEEVATALLASVR